MPLRGVARRAAASQSRKGVSNDLVMLGGLVEEEHPTALRPNDLIRARNIVRKGRTTGTRPGLEQTDGDYNAAVSGTPGCQGAYEFRYGKDANRRLLTVFDGNVYRDDSTALTKGASVTISSGDNYFWTFDTFQNKVWGAGGNTAADSVWHWDGSGSPGTLSKFDLATAGITAGAQFVFAKWNFLFLSGFNGTAYNDNPLVWRYCDFGTDATSAANWNAANVIPGNTLAENFGPGSYGAEYSTGMGSYQDSRNDFLLCLTNRRIITFAPNLAVTGNPDAFVMQDAIDTGCVHQNAFVNLGMDVGDAVYLSQDGIHSLSLSNEYGNRRNSYLSWPIRKTFDNLNRSRLKYASGTYWPNEGLVLFLVTSGSGSTHNLILCMDIKDADRITPDTVRWYKWDFDSTITPNFITVARGSNDVPYCYVGDLQGRLMRFGRSTYNDMTKGISADLITKNDDYDMPHKQKTIGDTFVALQGNGSYNITHQTLLDDGQRMGESHLVNVPGGGAIWNAFDWGEAEWGSNEATVRHRIACTGSSPTVAHRFYHSNANQPFWITSLSQEVFVSGSTTDAEANPVTS